MNYEKAYREALERAREIIKDYENRGLKDNLFYAKEDFEVIFPELKESEDERIRKALVNALNKNLGNGIEKYGTTLNAALAWLEKQGEKKPSDKVEPKFKVGDWIIRSAKEFKHSSFLVKEIKDYYICEDLKGRRVIFTTIDVEENFSLWTIQDAKDGDVLMSRAPFIYGKQCPYGGLNWYNGKFIKASNYVFTDSPVHPATKAQRDLLFQKMKEAGYEWDADNLEVKKIEPKFKVGDKIKYNGDIYVITEVNKNRYDVAVLSVLGSEGKVCSCIGFWAEDKMKLVQEPCARIYFADFNGGEGYYKLSLDNLNKKQVEAIEALVADWNKKV